MPLVLFMFEVINGPFELMLCLTIYEILINEVIHKYLMSFLSFVLFIMHPLYVFELVSHKVGVYMRGRLQMLCAYFMLLM